MAIANFPPGALSGPITPTMLRLALPTIVVLIVQTLVGVAETYFVSSSGPMRSPGSPWSSRSSCSCR